MSIGLAFKTFFRVLGNRDYRERIRALEPAAIEAPPTEPEPERNDAVTLLATLQREARFVDFLMEPLDDFSDAEIGPVARDVHAGCSDVLKRLFKPERLREETEGDPVTVEKGFDAGHVRLSGSPGGKGPFKGTLLHAGWKAACCKLPEWEGNASAASVLAPAQVDVQG